MGLDCKLLPNQWGPRFREVHGHMLACTSLDLTRHYALFEQLPGYNRDDKLNLDGTVVDFDVEVYEDRGIKPRRTDSYGAPLRWVAAGELAKVKTDETSPWNKAVFAFIQALPPETEIVIYWH